MWFVLVDFQDHGDGHFKLDPESQGFGHSIER